MWLAVCTDPGAILSHSRSSKSEVHAFITFQHKISINEQSFFWRLQCWIWVEIAPETLELSPTRYPKTLTTRATPDQRRRFFSFSSICCGPRLHLSIYLCMSSRIRSYKLLSDCESEFDFNKWDPQRQATFEIDRSMNLDGNLRTM